MRKSFEVSHVNTGFAKYHQNNLDIRQRCLLLSAERKRMTSVKLTDISERRPNQNIGEFLKAGLKRISQSRHLIRAWKKVIK